ncbi:M1 family metallopeptidase [Kineosporia mesophila]|uniref:Aminopeptidase N n=1 Tax=Kineosporia mesophila TaxID=566012 RepID=A0ABP7AP21_9ACTN
MRHPAATAATVSLGLLAAVGVPGTALASAGGGVFDPRPGSAGIGDRLYPTLGNGGYDAQHYDLDVKYLTGEPSSGIDGSVTMKARATQDLSRFDLDFSGDSVGAVTVNGRKAGFRRDGEDLVITPAKALHRGATFTVTVSHFTATPTEPIPGELLSAVFFITPDGSATSGQPNAMHAVYPSNDHPRDKASFTISMNVPKNETAVANGVLQHKKTRGDRTTWTYEQRQPMATELTQLAAGQFTVIDQGKVNGVPVRDVVPTRLVDEYKSRLAVSRKQIAWMEKRVTKYPFDLYGSLVVDTQLGFALETQTLSLYDTPWWDYPEYVWDPVMNHELAHQWFGDDVAPWEWSDVWLNEGHATWYEQLYAFDQPGYTVGTFDDSMKAEYADANIQRAENGPVAQPRSGDVYDVFNSNVYGGGALVLYALRQKIGTQKFVALERAWVTKYSGKSASTADFIALASKVSGHDQSAFLKDWLYGTTVPPMPGHPDWTATDPGSASAQRSAPSLAPLVKRDARI